MSISLYIKALQKWSFEFCNSQTNADSGRKLQFNSLLSLNIRSNMGSEHEELGNNTYYIIAVFINWKGSKLYSSLLQ